MSSTVGLLLSYIRPYSFRILIAFLLFVFVVAGIYMYRSVYSKQTTVKPFTDIANTAPTGKDIVVTLYYVDWCPHCKTAKPEWNKFVDEYNNQNVNGYRVVCVDLNCTDDDNEKIQQMLTKQKIDSFPTVRAVIPGDNGKEMTIRFESKTTKTNLEKFILSISSKN
jgi:thiol-disulfide isomerase/thioredoxin